MGSPMQGNQKAASSGPLAEVSSSRDLKHYLELSEAVTAKFQLTKTLSGLSAPQSLRADRLQSNFQCTLLCGAVIAACVGLRSKILALLTAAQLFSRYGCTFTCVPANVN